MVRKLNPTPFNVAVTKWVWLKLPETGKTSHQRNEFAEIILRMFLNSPLS